MSEWISVKDRLPKEGIRILTLGKYGEIKDRALIAFKSGIMLFIPDGLLIGKDITHWMPLPEPPEEG